MLKWLAPKFPSRSRRTNLTRLILDNGRSKVIFNTDVLSRRQSSSDDAVKPPPQYLVYNKLPPAPASDPDTPNISLCPPFHIHLKEDETFHVLSGTARFLLLDQRAHGPPIQSTTTDAGIATSNQDGITALLAPPSTTITIPRGQIHTFRNASTTHLLEIEFGFSPSSSPLPRSPSPSSSTFLSISTLSPDPTTNLKLHTFFLQTQQYRADCTRHAIPRFLPQILLFNHHADIALVPAWLLSLHRRYPFLRGLLERLVPILGRIMNVLGGVVLGRWLLGLKPVYEEYAEPIGISEAMRTLEGEVVEAEGVLREVTRELEGVKREMAEGGIGCKKVEGGQEAHPSVCQAWRDHSFDGQNEGWRK